MWSRLATPAIGAHALASPIATHPPLGPGRRLCLVLLENARHNGPVFLCQTKHSPSPSLSKSKKASLNSAICSSLSCVAVADSVIFLCYGVNACAVKWQLWTRLVDDRQFSFGSTKNLLLLLRIKPKNNPSTTSSLVSAMNPPGLSQDKSCQDRNSTGNTNTGRAHQTRQRRRKNPTGQYEVRSVMHASAQV